MINSSDGSGMGLSFDRDPPSQNSLDYTVFIDLIAFENRK